MSEPLTFDAFQEGNAARCEKAFPMCDDWTLNDWAVALAGEVGEMCNLLKKDRRGLASDERYDLNGPYQEMAREAVVSELCDIITYADLMMTKRAYQANLKSLKAQDEMLGSLLDTIG